MSLLSKLASMLGGKWGKPEPTAGMPDVKETTLLAGVMALINHPSVGGIPGLVQKFNSVGLGHLIQGWISTGPNPPVTGDELQSALGSDRLAEIARKLGCSPEQAKSKLSTLLPEVIDKMTPGGVIPPEQAKR